MDDLLSEFLTETTESLTELDGQMVQFEQDPTDSDILGNIFRLVHTIKGTCGFLGLPRLESVAHAGENVLGKFRDGVLEVTPEAVTLILKCLDRIRELLDELEANQVEPEGSDQEIIDELNAMASGQAAPSPSVDAAPVESGSAGNPSANEFGAPVAAELLAEVEAATSEGFSAASDEQMAAENANKGTTPPANEFGAPVATELLEEVMAAEAEGIKAASSAAIDAEMAAERAMESEANPPAAAAQVPARASSKEAAKKEDKVPKESAVAASTIRVHVEVLEDLMTMVSELVLTRNQLNQMVRGHDDSEFTVPLQRLSHITSDLQEGVMKTRMQPIGNAWAKLPRIVRDLSVESGKKIELKMIGAETELDRQVLDLIKDPLTHMVRNSADHGLEMPADRVAVGKPELGTVTLSAYHEGGHIIIQIVDDGRGLNTDRIIQKIIDNNLATESEIEDMTDQQIHMHIFKAGFSTAEKVTSVSGRGVGMDVVRTNIEKIGGTVELNSIEGKGSTFMIKIPLTLAIVSALIVECSSERFAIPQISVLELVRASPEAENKIEMINESPVLRLRNRLLPLVHLHDLLKLGEKKENNDDELFIVVAQVGAYTFGIIVDRVFDTEEIVVKPVAPVLRDIPFYSGNTILGDGSVIMILDPNGIANSTGDLGQAKTDADADAAAISRADDTSTMLIFRAGGNELKAVPLALVARLEEVDMESTEQSHGTFVVQYRGHLMPLIPFDRAHEWKTEGRQPILVFTDRDRSMGLVVDDIVDIVEDKLKIELSASEDGLIGSAIIDGKATDVIDAGYFLTQAFSDWFGDKDGAFGTGEAVHGSKKILLVDDSPFFRNLLRPVLSVAGYEVTTVDNAGDALKMRESGAIFDVIISDIEMPEMDGFEFAEAVRAGGAWARVPLVALSSHATEQDFERGRQVGFSEYVAKFDREALVSTLADTVSTLSASA
ncbi:MAG: chemotaxis protein CheW [Rhodospirillaceae bacterium]|nr:chemotaxis protein CheW [Rhodospirillaceae bacterium]MBL6932998.1 chemotaxis protein CheW [Rhodospirillales bacterium]